MVEALMSIKVHYGVSLNLARLLKLAYKIKTRLCAYLVTLFTMSQVVRIFSKFVYHVVFTMQLYITTLHKQMKAQNNFDIYFKILS